MSGTHTALPFPSVIHGIGQFVLFTARMLRVIAPQLLLSAVALSAYASVGEYPVSAIALHLCAIGLIQVLFYGLWAQAIRHDSRRNLVWLRPAFALCQTGKGVALNVIYLASFVSMQLWHSYLSWDNVLDGLRHLAGFEQALGWIVPVSLAGFAALLGLAAWIFYLKAPRLFDRLRANHRSRHQGGFTLGLTFLLGLMAGLLWLFEPNSPTILPKDPLVAFWQPTPARAFLPTPAMLVEQRAADFVPPGEFHRRNVIIITVDCLRRDHLPFHGYRRNTAPFLQRLIATQEASRVDLAVSNGNYSAHGKLSILSSKLPFHQQYLDFKIQDALKRAGYRTHLIAAGDNTHLQNMRRQYGPNFDVFFDGLSPSIYGMNDDRRVIECAQNLPPADGTPSFFYFHLMSAHELGLRLPEYQRWQPSALVLDVLPLLTRHVDPTMMTNTYDNGIAQADHYLEQLFSVLRAKGYLDDSVAVILGDHGQGLGEHGVFGHFGRVYMEDIGIPIIFVDSQKNIPRLLPFGSQIDVAPTLFSMLGLPSPAQWQGRSLLLTDQPRTVFSECRKNGEIWRCAIQQRPASSYKYILIQPPHGPAREMLYNLSVDPGEKSDLAAATAEASLVTEMRNSIFLRFEIPHPATTDSPWQIAQGI